MMTTKRKMRPHLFLEGGLDTDGGFRCCNFRC
jgi:hypothetical protein